MEETRRNWPKASVTFLNRGGQRTSAGAAKNEASMPAPVAPQVTEPVAQPVAETLTKTAAYTLVEAAGLTKDQLSAALDAGQVYGAVAGANKSYNVPRASLLAWIAATGGDVTAAEAV